MTVTEQGGTVAEDRLLTTAEVARLLGLQPDTIKLWRYRKTGPAFYRFGEGRIRYRLSDVEDYLAALRVERDGRGGG
jgi:predicted DNA-binding transcriptional regulator AlpA